MRVVIIEDERTVRALDALLTALEQKQVTPEAVVDQFTQHVKESHNVTEQSDGNGGVKPALLTVKEASELLNIPQNTLYREIKEGRLSVVRLGKRGMRVRRSEVERILEG